MPMLDIPNRARELGRIRAGEQRTSQKGKKYPASLDTWRLTSPQRDYLTAAADVYGGKVTEWTDAPTDGDQWQVTLGTDTLDVLVPPPDVVDAISQWWETWSGGGCMRRCNGQFGGPGGSELAVGDACLCPADLAERVELSRQNPPRACKPTTRVTLILPQLPDLGVWRLEAKGMNAAVELPGAIGLLQRGTWVPARLRLDRRTAKRNGETHHFSVPVIEVPQVTFGQLLAGHPGPPGVARQQEAIEPSQRAIPAAAGTTAARAVASAPTPQPQQRPADGARAALRGEQGAFGRNIVSAAKRAGLTDTQLASIVEEIAGTREPAEVHDPAHANAILAEIGKYAARQAS